MKGTTPKVPNDSSREGLVVSRYPYADEAERLAAQETDCTREEGIAGDSPSVQSMSPSIRPGQAGKLSILLFLSDIHYNGQNAASYNPGRMDQYLWPLLRGGHWGLVGLPREGPELLDCLWIKFSKILFDSDTTTAEYGRISRVSKCIIWARVVKMETIPPVKWPILYDTAGYHGCSDCIGPPYQ